MSARLWDKGGAIDGQILRYTARDDWQLDQRLLAYDIRASVAHVRGLSRIGVLSGEERDALVRELEALAARNEAGELRLGDQDEDGHTALEAALVARLGDVGKKVHTGRSRNDQVLVAMRLYERDALDELLELTRAGGRALLDLARREAETPMPGYTHLQRAVPSSFGYWAASFAEGLADALQILGAARALCDRSPLGGAPISSAPGGVDSRPMVRGAIGGRARTRVPLRADPVRQQRPPLDGRRGRRDQGHRRRRARPEPRQHPADLPPEPAHGAHAAQSRVRTWIN